VPFNLGVADSWYASAESHGLSGAASKRASLDAARTRSASSGAAGPALTPAIPSGPPVDQVAGAGESALAELSFAAPAQPFEVNYFVEVVALEAASFRSAFTGNTNRSAMFVRLPQRPLPDYVPSAWKYFSVR
jgi:hypothetical protein